MQLLGVLAQARSWLLVAHHRELAPEDREGQLPHGGVRGNAGRAEIGRAGDLLADGEQPRLELREAGRLEPTGQPEFFDDRLQRVEPVGLDLDLDPPELHGALARPDHDHRVVERDLCHLDAADPQREGSPAGAHLEDLAQRRGNRQWRGGGARPARRGRARTIPTGEDLGDLQTLAQPAALGGPVVLQGDLVLTAAAPGADDEAGAHDAPIVAVEIRVHQTPGRSRQRRHRTSVAGLYGESREGGQPALHGPQIEGVELPLDLDGVVPARFLCALV